MTAASLELQEAVFAALAGDAALTSALGGPRFHDVAPAATGFPYITFGRATVYDWSTASEAGSEHFFTLDVWSKHKGRREALALMELVRAALHDRVLTLAGHRLANLRMESAQVSFEAKLGAYRGRLHFRAAVE